MCTLVKNFFSCGEDKMILKLFRRKKLMKFSTHKKIEK